MTDLTFGAVGSILGGIALFAYVYVKNRKTDKWQDLAVYPASDIQEK
jgi:hypothetical protein